jgi:FkbM family methyltransferase
MRLRLRDVLQARLLLDGEWEPELTRWWMFLAARANVVFDVGAHCGYYTLYAHKVAPRTRIHAFEPHPELLADLSGNLDANGSDENVTVVPFAVSDRDGDADFHVRDVEPGSSSFTPLGAGGITFDRSISVPTVALDSYRQANDIPVVDLVKIDIEGAELAALRGMRNGMRRGEYRVLVMEVHPVGDDVAPLRDFLRRCLVDSGYRVYRMQGTTAVPLGAEKRVPEFDTWIAVHREGADVVEPAERDGRLVLPDTYAEMFTGSRWKPARRA